MLSTIAAFVTLLGPETVGRRLPETVDEIDNWSITLSKEEKHAYKEGKKLRKAMRVARKESTAENGNAVSTGEVNLGFEQPTDYKSKL